MAKTHERINRHPHTLDADLRMYLKNEACPECGESKHIEAASGDEESYVDNEEMCMTEDGPRFFPYKDYVCANCGAEFRTYWGVVAIRVTKEPDVEID